MMEAVLAVIVILLMLGVAARAVALAAEYPAVRAWVDEDDIELAAMLKQDRIVSLQRRAEQRINRATEAAFSEMVAAAEVERWKRAQHGSESP